MSATRPPVSAIPESVVRAVRHTAERLCGLYALDLELARDPTPYVVPTEVVRDWLPEDAPRTGVAVLEEGDAIWLALYLDSGDRRDPAAIFEETSHLVCLSWHARQERPISGLALELQAEVDRYALARLAGDDAFAHFGAFRWAEPLRAPLQERYESAHRSAYRYCRRLHARFPRVSDLPAWCGELRRFYRAAPQAKLRAGAA